MGWLFPVAMAGVFLYRGFLSDSAAERYKSIALAVLLLVGAMYLQSIMVKLIPVGINLAMLYFFGKTLRRGPSLIEHFARLDYPVFKPGISEYCHQVTITWVVFFAANAMICMGLALWASDAAWAFYNGVLFYVLMGVLFVGEYIVRHLRLPHLEIPSPLQSFRSIVKNAPKVWRDVLMQ